MQSKTATQKAELEEALRLYVQFHLKPGELEKFPELKNYLPSTPFKN